MSEKREKHYWGYKIAGWCVPFFWHELQHGRLRQGFGYKDSYNLSLPDRDYSGGNKLNYKIYDNVKKGDILLIRRLPDSSSKVAVVEATDDFNKGYKFEVAREFEGQDLTGGWNSGDFGHIFPARFLRYFSIGCIKSNASLQRAMRFWPPTPRISYIGHLKNTIEDIIRENDRKKLEDWATPDARIQQSTKNAFQDMFDMQKFSDQIYELLLDQFIAAGWEDALIAGLQKLFPCYDIIPTGGAGEKKHGTDILVKIPSIAPEHQYAIAIQVKDYSWVVDNNALEQIAKAENWSNIEDIDLIDKILVLIKAKKEDNPALVKSAEDKGIKVIFANDLKILLSNIAVSYLGIDSEYIS